MTWDEIRAMPTTRNNEHESLCRSYHVLIEAKNMLDRGDSNDTVRAFIEWAYADKPASKLVTGLRSEEAVG